MTFAPNPPHRRVGAVFANLRRLALYIILTLLVIGIFAFRGVGRWLVRPDALAHADAMVILSGGLPYRAEEAANLYRTGYAQEVWITRPQSAAELLHSMDIHYFGEEDYDRQILLRSGIPDQSIQILPGTIIDTQQELTETIDQMRREGKASVLIVTSPEHTRRVRALWKVLANKNLKAIVCASPQAPFDADHWWRDTRDAYSVLRELMGLTNVWLRLPVRPAKG
jgi:uncharacterized SAM-binding protein YcdF (DUF218 family)